MPLEATIILIICVFAIITHIEVTALTRQLEHKIEQVDKNVSSSYTSLYREIDTGEKLRDLDYNTDKIIKLIEEATKEDEA